MLPGVFASSSSANNSIFPYCFGLVGAPPLTFAGSCTAGSCTTGTCTAGPAFFRGALYPSLNPFAISAPAMSLAPKLLDLISEKMKCLNNFPCFFISLLSKLSIFERRAFNLGECVGIDSNNF